MAKKKNINVKVKGPGGSATGTVPDTERGRAVVALVTGAVQGLTVKVEADHYSVTNSDGEVWMRTPGKTETDRVRAWGLVQAFNDGYQMVGERGGPEFAPPTFPPGTKVVFTNDYGVSFPGRTIERVERDERGDAYYITPTDAPWFPVRRKNLTIEYQKPAQD